MHECLELPTKLQIDLWCIISNKYCYYTAIFPFLLLSSYTLDYIALSAKQLVTAIGVTGSMSSKDGDKPPVVSIMRNAEEFHGTL